VVLPNAVPFIVAGARIGIALAFICLVAAEMAGAFGGIGYRISVSHLVFRVDKMMVGLVVLGILGATADALFAKGVLFLMPWYEPPHQ
jgi:ABC-type nitrate/sulfonate/bicarbonate transport system permease component